MFGLALYQVIFIGLFLLLGVGISLISLLRIMRVYSLLLNKGKDFFVFFGVPFYDYLIRVCIIVIIFWFLIAGVSFAIINLAIPEAVVLSIFIICYIIVNFTDNERNLK